jgi:hypothetical protein
MEVRYLLLIFVLSHTQNRIYVVGVVLEIREAQNVIEVTTCIPFYVLNQHHISTTKQTRPSN